MARTPKSRTSKSRSEAAVKANRTRALAKWVKLAENLARKYGGVPRSQTNSLAEWVRLAEKLARENGGTQQSELGSLLPRDAAWLRCNYDALVAAIKRHPTAFKPVRRNSLPCAKWLRAHGSRALNAAIEQHPELFKHTKRSRGK
jgi:hypothetical protein